VKNVKEVYQEQGSFLQEKLIKKMDRNHIILAVDSVKIKNFLKKIGKMVN